ncbi:hypothetical protein BKI52_05090 [marine bacterium AO1-C]|nr:hypothetical protein BKI52_05090 [marine bacterium AO1-C]
MKKVLFTLSLLMALFIGANDLFAQGATTASMAGVVTDANGAGLPGATLVAVHLPTGTQYGAATNTNGRFRFPSVRVGGPYKVTVTYVGFKDQVEEGFSLVLGSTKTFKFVMKEGGLQLNEVQVVARKSDILNGDRNGAETKIGEEEINVLPTASRNLTDYLRLNPQSGVSETGDGPAISFAGQNNRFNSIFIDGAVNNDVFGLSGSGTNGGQSGVSPISPDAIEQFQVVISPYDVTLGGFTGGGVNAVTRSGTNEFKGSVYFFTRNENFSGKTPTDNPDFERTNLNNFTANTYGLRIGGPLIKNKLFFFLNAEVQRDEESQPYSLDQGYIGNFTDGGIQGVRDYFINNYNYDPGDFLNNTRERRGNKILLKLDYNLNKNNSLTFRHSVSYAEETERNGSSNSTINFSNNAEFFPSTTNSSAIEWKSNFNSNLSNKMIIGYTTVRDDRGFVSNPFPRVIIRDQGTSGRAQLNIGSEQFSIGNVLEQDVLTFTDNLTYFKGKHTVTFGMHHEYYNIYNLFIRENFGVYTYNSFVDFVSGAAPANYTRTYVLKPGVDAAQGDNATDVAARIQALQLGFYVQDEFQVNDKLKLTGGLRLDVPTFLSTPEANPTFNTSALPAMAAAWGVEAGTEAGSTPDAQLLFSPRFGFNYDIRGDRTFQLRGGLGLFTGRVPFVWPGGSFTNNGIFLAGIDVDNPTLASNGNPLPFNPNPNQQYVGSQITNAGVDRPQIDLFAKNFKYAQVFRTSLAVDYQLPFGLVATLEALYTKNINSIAYRNINVEKPTRFFTEPDGTQRPVYNGTRIDNNYDRVPYAFNRDNGYSYNLTASINKPFSNGWTAGASYTFGRSKVLFDGTSSQNSSNWRNVEVIDRNELVLGFSDFDLGSRINIFASYRIEYAKLGATTLSVFYNGQSGRRFSYTYAGTFNFSANNGFIAPGGDDESGRFFNDLIFIPADQSQINLVDYTDSDGNTVTAAEQWAALNQYIEDDPYLSKNRGKVAERNGGRAPFENIIDLKFMQEFFVNVGGKRNTLQFSLDIFNFTNMLNKNWGRRRAYGFDAVNLINFQGYDVDGSGNITGARYTYTNRRTKAQLANIDDTGIRSSRWQMQLGVRYIFN